MIFTAKIQIELDGDRLEDLRSQGYKDTEIIHWVCYEIQGQTNPHLTEFGELEFTDCEIVESKEKERLPF